MTEELKDKELTDIKYLRARMTGNVGLALDHAYNLGFFDGEKNIVKKIRDEIEQTEINGHIRDVECFRAGIDVALNVIDKYIAEDEDD